jgi:hypothetical protein
MGALALLLSSAVCMAAPVQDRSGGLIVKVGPLVGTVTPYDRVNGRFSLRVGPLRTRNGLSQKIPWFPDPGAEIGSTLVVTGRALSAPTNRTFTQTFRVALSPSMFPTIIAPPSTGCWMFTFTTGPTTASIAVLVRPRPTS